MIVSLDPCCVIDSVLSDALVDLSFLLVLKVQQRCHAKQFDCQLDNSCCRVISMVSFD